jgi:hypothetical protein
VGRTSIVIQPWPGVDQGWITIEVRPTLAM